MKKNLIKQYNSCAEIFSLSHDNGNKYSNRVFFETLRSLNLQNKKILDLGCGNGTDMKYYQYRFSKNVYGVDASEKLLLEARGKNLNVELGYFDKIPYLDNQFDAVLSKYALQTVAELSSTYKEASRVLKSKGKFVFMVVHPLRQFMEKKTNHKNYFDKTLVKSILFNGKLTVTEPTHTIQEYLSPEFFKYFSLKTIFEKDDFYSAEKIGNNIYPTYLIISAEKK